MGLLGAALLMLVGVVEVAAPAVSDRLDLGDESGGCTDDAIIDPDGTAIRVSGDPEAHDVSIGDELSPFPVAEKGDARLDAWERDGNGQWTLSDGGQAGDERHVDGPAFCDSGVGDRERETRGVTYHDANDDGGWDDGEDIVLDTDGDLVFD